MSSIAATSCPFFNNVRELCATVTNAQNTYEEDCESNQRWKNHSTGRDSSCPGARPGDKLLFEAVGATVRFRLVKKAENIVKLGVSKSVAANAVVSWVGRMRGY